MDRNSIDSQKRKSDVLKDLSDQRKKIKKDLSHYFIMLALFGLAYLAMEWLLFAIIDIVLVVVIVHTLLVDLPKNSRQAKQVELNQNLDEIEAEVKKEKQEQAELDKQLAEIDAKSKAAKEAQHAYDHPECPMCKSHNTRRISTTNRAASIALVGLASDKIGKQYECFNCKHKW